MTDVTITYERVSEEVPVPTKATAGSAGYDVCAYLTPSEQILLAPGARYLVPTGLRFRIPPGWELQVRPRSGLAMKQGITVLNSPGTIDSDYRGTVGVILVNSGDRLVTIKHGERIAQLVPSLTYSMDLVPGSVAEDTDRGAGGFGSTGV